MQVSVTYMYMYSGVWFDKSKKNKSWKMSSGLGSPFGLEDKAPLNLMDV